MVSQWMVCTNTHATICSHVVLAVVDVSREGHCLTDVSQPIPKEWKWSAECLLGRSFSESKTGNGLII